MAILHAHLARNTLGHVHTARRVLPARYADTCPRPVTATAHPALDVDVQGLARHRAGDVLQHKVGDRNAVRGLAVDAVVALVHDDAVVGAAGYADVAVRDAVDGAVRAGNGFLARI